MTAEDWQHADEPHAMLEFLQKDGNPSARKLRLFAVACSRRVWPRIDSLGRAAIDVAERFADGFASAAEMRAARLACQNAGGSAAWYAAASNPTIAARNAARSAQVGVDAGAEMAELLAQAYLIRDIFGDRNMVHSFGSIWRQPAVIHLARLIYDERAFDRMPDLAGALENAGCLDEAFLNHCRESALHVRGCQAIDLILGFE